MAYDFYYESKDAIQQFWYDATLGMLVLSPLVFLFSVFVQSAWNRGAKAGRWRYPAITIALWATVPVFAKIADIPIMDYLFDCRISKKERGTPSMTRVRLNCKVNRTIRHQGVRRCPATLDPLKLRLR